MENAAKALLIAAAILILVMILSLLVVAYGQVSDFFQREHENTVVEQLERFNNQFDNYKGTTIRGNEMLSIINKVIDYNTLQAESAGYDKITLEFSGIDNDVITQFKYNEKDESILNVKEINTNGSEALSNQVNELLSLLYSKGIEHIKESHLQTLSENADYVLKSNTAEEEDVYYRNKLIKNTLNVDLEKKPELLEPIQEATKKYYQLVQFKRAYFKCTQIGHTTKTGRVIKMVFEIVKDDEGNVKSE